jgi:hypothetical protein
VFVHRAATGDLRPVEQATRIIASQLVPQFPGQTGS